MGDTVKKVGLSKKYIFFYLDLKVECSPKLMSEVVTFNAVA